MRRIIINALLGFSLGVAIVLVVVALSGKSPFDQQSQANYQLLEENTVEAAHKDEKTTESGEEVQDEDYLSWEGKLNVKDLETTKVENRFTILLIGTDNRPGETLSNTDTLIVASLDQKNKKMVLLSIPRDTQILIKQNKEKINALARLTGGPKSLENYVQELLATPIHGYVMTNFQGFKSIVDSLGGITINVEKDMYYDTGDVDDRFINLKKGSQRLNGSQALQYARFRNDELADISRVSRQQEVIKAILAEATNPRNIPKLPLVIPKTYQAIDSNLNLAQIWSLVMVFKDKDSYEVVSQTLPGYFSDEEGISYWKIDPKDAKGIVEELFKGHKAPVFNNSPQVYPTNPQYPQNHGIDQKISQDRDEEKNQESRNEHSIENQEMIPTIEIEEVKAQEDKIIFEILD